LNNKYLEALKKHFLWIRLALPVKKHSILFPCVSGLQILHSTWLEKSVSWVLPLRDHDHAELWSSKIFGIFCRLPICRHFCSICLLALWSRRILVLRQVWTCTPSWSHQCCRANIRHIYLKLVEKRLIPSTLNGKKINQKGSPNFLYPLLVLLRYKTQQQKYSEHLNTEIVRLWWKYSISLIIIKHYNWPKISNKTNQKMWNAKLYYIHMLTINPKTFLKPFEY
jgi:hypothetical protein